MAGLELVFLILFIVFVVIHLVGEVLIHLEKKSGMIIRYITKPFLIPLLATYYILSIYFTSGIESVNWFIFVGLILGLAGDLLLINRPDPEEQKVLFMLGLVSFLLGHIFYLVAFVLTITAPYTFTLWTLGILIPLIIYGVLIGVKILPTAEEMKIPVLAYILIIFSMGIIATMLFGEMSTKGYLTLLVGVLLFIISDTINAWYKFIKEFQYERLLVMSTYLASQFFIVLGFVLA
ncbi:MAG: lysoplasmalogenase [Candidatus Heimdallarchaeota archaeon]